MKKGTDRQSLCAEAIIEGVEANLQNLMQVYDQLYYIDPRFAYDRMRFDRAGLEKATAWIKERIERTDEAEDIFYDWCFYSRDGIVAKAKNMTEPGARRRALEEYLAIPSAERPEATFRIECVVWEQYEYRLPDDAKEYETYEEASKALVDYLMKKHPSDEYVYINAALKGSGAYEQTREGIFRLPYETFAREHWLPEWAVYNLSPGVRQGYVVILEQRAFPVIGEIEISKIRPVAIKGILVDMLDSGKSVGTVRRTRSVISSVFRYAEDLEAVQKNP